MILEVLRYTNSWNGLADRKPSFSFALGKLEEIEIDGNAMLSRKLTE